MVITAGWTTGNAGQGSGYFSFPNGETVREETKPLTRLVRALAKGQIILPIEFRRRLGIDSETILNLTLKGDRIEIVPLRPLQQEEKLRSYAQDEIQRFLKEDRIDATTAAKVRRLLGRKRSA